MRWDPKALPAAVLEQRTVRLQSALRAAQFDALVIYTNIVRPAAVTYLTAFTPYWSDALLLVPREGPPVFATALSKRVANWIRSTNPLSEIVHSPKPGVVIGERLRADGSVHRVGVLEYDMLPEGIAEDLAGAVSDVTFADATKVFTSARSAIDTYEARLLSHADRLVMSALGQERPAICQAGELLGEIEYDLRCAGAEETYLSIATDLHKGSQLQRNPGARPVGAYFAVSVAAAWKGSWVRRTRCFARNAAELRVVSECDTWWHGALQSFYSGSGIGQQINLALAALPRASLRYWAVEGCRASYPLEVLGSSSSTDFIGCPGSIAMLSVGLDLDQTPWVVAAPFIVGDDRWYPLTGDTQDRTTASGAAQP